MWRYGYTREQLIQFTRACASAADNGDIQINGDILRDVADCLEQDTKQLHWERAIHLARKEYMSYAEWCSLYYSEESTGEQIAEAAGVAWVILHRNSKIADDVVIITDGGPV